MRYVSYAQNRLDKWLQVMPFSEKARFLDAQVKQYNHQFKAAVIQLKSLLEDYPENNEAWSLLANIQLLTGDYQSAKISCKQLSRNSGLVDTIICQSNIMIRIGELSKANKMLEVLASMSEQMPVMQKIWLYTSLAEIKIQQGDHRADSFILQAMEMAEENKVNDDYLLRMFIDYLVQAGQFKKAFELIKDNNSDSALMIRATVLAKKLGNEVVFEANKAALTQVFNIEKRRGTSRHLREHALFTLLVLDQPDKAVKLAKQNWLLQKEPEDARILMKSALLSGDHSHLQWVKNSIKKTGMADQRLDESRLRESLL